MIKKLHTFTEQSTFTIYLFLQIFLGFIWFNTSAQEVAEVWSQRFDAQGPGNETVQASVLDESGNLYLTGTSYTADTQHNSEIVTAKYAPSGELLWTKRFVMPYDTNTVVFSEEARAIALDEAGGVYVTGLLRNSSSYRNGSILTFKLDAANGEQTWHAVHGPGGYGTTVLMEPAALAVDKNGGVYVTGKANNSTVASGYDYITLKYNTANGAKIWEQTYNGARNFNDEARSIAVDDQGGVYVTGTSLVDIDMWGSRYAYVTLKYNASDGTQVWRAQYAEGVGVLNDPKAIVLDGMGGVYVAGTSQGDGKDFATVKYAEATGAQLWAARYSRSMGDDEVSDLAVDGAGGVYVTGRSAGTSTLTDFTTVRYQAQDGQQAWVKHYADSQGRTSIARTLAVGERGEVYVTGQSYGHNSIASLVTLAYHSADGAEKWRVEQSDLSSPGDRSIVLAGTSGQVYTVGSAYKTAMRDSDYIISQYSAAEGTQLWTTRFEGLSSTKDAGSAVVVDAAGYTYVAGNTYSLGKQTGGVVVKYAPSGEQLWVRQYDEEKVERFDAIALDNAGGVYVAGTTNQYDYLTMKLQAEDGGIAWLATYDGGAGEYDAARSVVVDAAGGVYVTGTSYSHGTGRDYATIKYNAVDGAPEWVARYDGQNADDEATAMVLDGQGSLYVTGLSHGQSFDFATIRYDVATGAQLWASRYDGSGQGDDIARAITVDAAGDICVTGEIVGADRTRDYAILKYSAADGTQRWVTFYEGNGGGDYPCAIAADKKAGIYVTGYSALDRTNSSFAFATLKMNAEDGTVAWLSSYGVKYKEARAEALELDKAGNVYVAGSWAGAGGPGRGSVGVLFKYSGKDGAELWQMATKGYEDDFFAMTLDAQENIIATGRSFSNYTDNDILTVKYSQEDLSPCNTPVQVQLYLPPSAKQVGHQVRTTADFGQFILAEDTGIRWTWGDGSTPSISYTSFGTGRITGQHTYTAAGIYPVGLDFSESCLKPENAGYEQWLPVYDPEAGFVTGAGSLTFAAAPFALAQAGGELHFNFNLRYGKKSATAPQGQMSLVLNNRERFKSSSMEWLVISGEQAVWAGEGTLNGKGRYGFIASATDAGGPGITDRGDRLRIRIWDLSRGNVLVFDNYQEGGEILDMASVVPAITKGQVLINTQVTHAANKDATEAGQLRAYPNTFSDKTTISFMLAHEQEYVLEVYNLNGTPVGRLGAGKAKAGKEVKYELKGSGLKAGIYVARLVTDTGAQSIKVILKR
ncbi:putative secreted protein (Por secretion system target) [Pontibacter mucosus]|uniref:Putative secreted protein (Por secretion system target) n=1 Tax=Pontibacter mucosus TaxID=1649266 RepID=A0A2T5YDX7_9BACT|nr:SBBP repeat-containing protein [Pontibacter mucosus]PTX14919.1 putative secreted protein (Por secretion system target) [Pontibacter mucosus]